MKKRDDFIAAGVIVVEIDLNRQGERTDPRIDRVFSKLPYTPYVRVLYRGGQWREIEVCPLPFRERLGAIPIPLREGDSAAVLDLQPLLDLTLQKGLYPVDYSKPLDPPIHADEAAWAASEVAAFQASRH